MQNHISFQEKVKPLIRIVQASQHFKVILVTLEPLQFWKITLLQLELKYL